MAWLNCGISALVNWPDQRIEVKYGDNYFVLMPMTKDNSASIHIDLKYLSDVEALTAINRFLSALSWKCDAPSINNYGWAGNSMPVPVLKSKMSNGGCPLKYFPTEVYEIKDEKAKLAIALYKEGLSLNSVPYRFLSYFKILNIFWKDNKIVEELRGEISKATDPESIQRIDEIKKNDGDPALYLYKSGRCAIAHAYSDPIVDPDNVEDLRNLSKDLYLIKTIVVGLIIAKFNIEQSIFA
jgi:hypothetical protein